jgi:hypothetical protein
MVEGSLLRVAGRLLQAASLIAIVLILAGLVGFLTDEVRGSSKVSATRFTTFNEVTGKAKVVDITEPDPTPVVERAREAQHTDAREVIDDIGDAMMHPFAWVAGGSEAWVQRLLQSAIALLLYGFLGMLLADRLRRWGEKSRRGAIVAAEEAAAVKRRESGTFASPA